MRFKPRFLCHFSYYLAVEGAQIKMNSQFCAELESKASKQFKGCLLSNNLYYLLVQYILTNKVRVPECSRLTEMSETFQDGAKQDRRALQSKFKSWAKRMYVREEDHILILKQTNKVIVPRENHAALIMNTHLGTGDRRDGSTHLIVDEVVETLKSGYSWGRRDFGLDWDIVVAVISTCPNKKCLVNLQKRFSPKSPPKKRPRMDSVTDPKLQLTPTTTKEKPLKPLNTLIQEMKALQAQDRKSQQAPRPVQKTTNTFQWNGNHHNPYANLQRVEEVRPNMPSNTNPRASYVLFPEDAHNNHNPWSGRVFRQIAPRPLPFTRVATSHDLTNVHLTSVFRNALCVQSSLSAGNFGRSEIAQNQNEPTMVPKVLDLSKKSPEENNFAKKNEETMHPAAAEVLPATRCFIKLMPKVEGTNGNVRDFSTLYDQLLKSVNTMRGKVRLVFANQGRGKSGDQFRAQNEFCLKTVREMQVRLTGDATNSA